MGTETPLVDELIEESLQQNQKIQGQKNVNTFGFYHDKDKGKIGYDADKYIDYFGDEYDIPVKMELDYSKNRKFRSSKHRYIYFVGNKSKVRKWKKELNYKTQDYPKGQNERYDASYKPNIQVQLF